MTTSQRFEDRLLHELRQTVTERPTPSATPYRRPRRTRLALAGAGIAAAAAAVAVFAASSNTPDAYAVQSGSGGAVTVSIRSLSDAAGLQRSLRAAGIPAVVDYAAAGQPGCVASPSGGVTTGGAPDGPTTESGTSEGGGPSLSGPGPVPGAPGAVTSQVSLTADGATFTIDPGTLGAGEKVFITTSTGAMSTIGMSIGKQKPGAAC